MEQQDIKLLFVAEALNEYMKNVTDAMRESIRFYKARDTDALLRSLSYKVYQQNAQGNANLNFAEWGRFLDMGARRGHPLGGAKATSKILNKNGKKVIPNKPRKLYSPIAYGQLNGLIGQLAYGFTEETINRLKQNLQA